MKSRVLALSLGAFLATVATASADELALGANATLNTAPVLNAGAVISSLSLGGYASNTISATGAISQTSITVTGPSTSNAAGAQLTVNTGFVANAGLIGGSASVGATASNTISAVGAASVVSISAQR